jgi:peptidyl-prolyl cis-trans isomerase C
MNSTVAGLARRFLPVLGVSAAAGIVALTGCHKQPPPTPDTNTPVSVQAPAPNLPAPLPQEDGVVATVNGTPIKESDVQKRIDARYKPILAKLTQQSPELAAQQEKVLRQNITQDLVTEVLLDEQARAAGVEITDEELQAEMNRQLAGQDPPMTIEQCRQSMEAQGFDFEVMKGFLARGMKYNKLVQSKFPGALVVTEEDAKKYYDENPDEFQLPERVRASHILLSTRPLDPNADPNQVKAQARQKAEELLQKAKSGADFAALAEVNSQDPISKAQGGDLGLFPRGQMVKPFEDAAFALQVGEISDLVETQFGYHIIKVTERLDPMPIPFDDAKTTIIEELQQKRSVETAREYVDSLRQNAKIVFPPGSGIPAPEPTVPQIVTPADANSQ